jgi:hypothetical protein
MTPEEFYAQEFARLKKEWDESKSTHWPALHDAVVLAHVNSIAPPEWVVYELCNLIRARHNASGRKHIRSKYAIDVIHGRRWNALNLQFKLRGIEYSKKRGRPNGTCGIQEARQAASDSLKKDIGFGTAREVQKSFDKVEKARGASADARYLVDR